MANDRSSIWDVAAWGALATGTGFGIKEAHPLLKQIPTAGNLDVAAQTAGSA